MSQHTGEEPKAWVDRARENHKARITLAGVDPQNVQTNAEDNMVSISAERKESHDYLCPELSCGTLD
jgi:HSP20 family molecular chaperone IbpA